jgi:uncharacterized protein (TIGR02596 family)
MKHPSSPGGFTLIEMICVIAIIAVLVTLIVPATNSLMTASELSGATDQVVGRISYARQAAIARNHTVEVRFYQFADPELPGEQAGNPATGKYRALQLFEYLENGAAVPLTKVEMISERIIFDSGLPLSPLLGATRKKTFAPPLDGPAILPRGVGITYNCAAFQFTPSGATRLALANWFLTLHQASSGDALTSPPANYATVQIDPVSGTVKSYRP